MYRVLTLRSEFSPKYRSHNKMRRALSERINLLGLGYHSFDSPNEEFKWAQSREILFRLCCVTVCEFMCEKLKMHRISQPDPLLVSPVCCFSLPPLRVPCSWPASRGTSPKSLLWCNYNKPVWWLSLISTIITTLTQTYSRQERERNRLKRGWAASTTQVQYNGLVMT